MRVGCKLVFGNALTHELYKVQKIDARVGRENQKKREEQRALCFFCKACHENRTLLCGLEE
jgi:cytochrome c553